MRTETFDSLVFLLKKKEKTYFLSVQVLRCQELQTVLYAFVYGAVFGSKLSVSHSPQILALL